MTGHPPESFMTSRSGGLAGVRTAPGGEPAAEAALVAARWAALHEAAGVVAALAGVEAVGGEGGARAFPAAIAEAGGWRLRLALQGMEDLSAILSAGITALLAVHGRGGQAAVPAKALWGEFSAARDGLLALCPEPLLGRRRIA